MEEGTTLCPICGTKNSEPEKKEKVKVKTPLWASICIGVLSAAVVALGVFAAMQYLPEKPAFKSYTGKDAKLEAARETVVATAGDRKLTNGELQAYYWVYIYSFLQENSSALSTLNLDLTKDFAKQECSVQKGSSWQEYFLENALKAWHQYISMVVAGEKADYKLPEDEQKYLDNFRDTINTDAGNYGYKDGEEMVKAEMGAGASLDAYIAYMEATFKGMGYYNYLCENIKLTEEQIAAYYEENKTYFESYEITKDDSDFAWVGVRHILLQPVATVGEDGKETYTEEAWEDCRKKAQDLLDSFLAGEATEEIFGTLAKEHTADGGSKANGGLYAQFFRNEMVEPFEEWSFDKTRKYGDTGLVKSDFGYHIMFFIEGEAQWRYYSDAELRLKEGEKLLKTAMEESPITVEYKKILLSHIDLAK